MHRVQRVDEPRFAREREGADAASQQAYFAGRWYVPMSSAFSST